MIIFNELLVKVWLVYLFFSEWVKERTAIPAAEWAPLLEQSGCEWTDVENKLVEVNINHQKLTIAKEDEASLPGSFADAGKPYLANWLQYYGPISTAEISEKTGLDCVGLETLLSTLVEERIMIQGRLIQDSDGDYWCDADNYEILLRFLRQKARISFEPLAITQLTPFLYNWQTRLAKTTAQEQLFDIIEMLRCYPSNPKMWESEILPARISGYQTSQLDLLFSESSLYWLGDVEKRINFTFSEDLDLLRDEPGEPSDDLNTFFSDRQGRYNFSTLLDKTGLSSSDLAEKLWQFVWQGEVTNDSVMSLRKGIETGYKVPAVAQREQHRNGRRSRRSGFNHWRGAIPFSGNWFRIEKPVQPQDLIEMEEINKDRVRILLDRYGVLFREILQHEHLPFQWRQIFRSLRLMELAGEVYSGYFFAGIPGPQFISPAALRLLQGQFAQRKSSERVFWINAADPISCCGIPFDSFRTLLPRRVASNQLTYHDKDLVLVATRNGRHLDIRVSPDHPHLGRYFEGLRHLLYRSFQPLNKITIESINDEPARQSPYVEALENCFEVISDYKAIYLQRSI